MKQGGGQADSENKERKSRETAQKPLFEPEKEKIVDRGLP